MDKTITITGIGKISAKPDLVTLNVTITARELGYEATMENSAVQLEGLRTAIAAAGFDRAALKTVSFNVNTHYENVRSGDTFKNVFKGFICSHALKLEFDLSMPILSKLLTAFSKCQSDPDFSVHFGIKDKDKLKKQLLDNAAKDAKQKAVILATALEKRLGDILTINYTLADTIFESPTRLANAKLTTRAFAIEPENIFAEENVTFVWALL